MGKLTRFVVSAHLSLMYRMYLDEHGVDQMLRLDLDQNRYLSLTGVVMQINHARDYLVPALNLIKAEIFGEDPDTPICLHRYDIRHRKGQDSQMKVGPTRLRDACWMRTRS